MLEAVIEVRNRLGLHARPAAMLVQTTSKFKARIKIVKDDQEVDGKSIMGILMLAAEYGSALKFYIDGEDEQSALAELRNLFDGKFGEQ